MSVDEDTAQVSCEAVRSDGTRCPNAGVHVHDDETVCGVHHRARLRSAECPVCLRRVPHSQLARMPCGHAFHAGCLRPWFKANALTCPTCRSVCLPGLCLLGKSLLRRIDGLLRTYPCPPGAFFPTHFIRNIERPEVAQALDVDRDTLNKLIAIAYVSFSREGFFFRLAAETRENTE